MEELPDRARKYFRELKIETVKKLYEVYKVDFEMFGYSPLLYYNNAIIFIALVNISDVELSSFLLIISSRLPEKTIAELIIWNYGSCLEKLQRNYKCLC